MKTEAGEQLTKGSMIRILLLAILMFVMVNGLFAIVNPELGNYSFYDHIFSGRKRFPFGENPGEAYNFSLNNLFAMFESHEVESIEPEEEYSVFLIGDSSVWGTLLTPEESLSGRLNEQKLIDPVSGLPIRFYNLGYPTISITKDLLILKKALQSYSPDMVIWMVTLESLPWERQLSSPLVQNNAEQIVDFNRWFGLPYDLDSPELRYENFWDRTIIGQRRELADLVRLQLYGVLWEATGIDQYYPDSYTPAQRDLDADETYYNFAVDQLEEKNLALEVIKTGRLLCGDSIKLVIINEPIMVSSGENSDLRYNFYYPQWAYDQYRLLMNSAAEKEKWNYFDLWDIIPEDEFTNSAIHMSPHGETILADAIIEILMENVGFRNQ